MTTNHGMWRVLISVLLTVSPCRAWAAGTPATACVSGKTLEVRKYGACRLKVEARFASDGDTGRRGQGLQRCADKLTRKWPTIESKAAGACPTTGDAANLQAVATQHTDTVVTVLSGDPFLTDNGDGTVFDARTGRIWEKKTGTISGGVLCTTPSSCPDPHDVNNRYTWPAAFTDFLDKLNNRCKNDPTIDCTVGGDADCAGPGGPCGFAGHRDWRLPMSGGYSEVPELESIIDQWAPLCIDSLGSACISPKFGPTFPQPYWSSSTVPVGLYEGAFAVSFTFREPSYDPRTIPYDKNGLPWHVRAVRP